MTSRVYFSRSQEEITRLNELHDEMNRLAALYEVLIHSQGKQAPATTDVAGLLAETVSKYIKAGSSLR